MGKTYAIMGNSAAYYRAYRAKHREKLNQQARESEQRRYVRALIPIDELKKRPCMDCGGVFPPECMDFDHVRGEKLFRISRGVLKRTEEEMQTEIAKCELVCSNCHRIRTRKRKKEKRMNMKPSHDIFHRPGQEGSAEGVDRNVDGCSDAVPSPSHDQIQKPGSEGSSRLSQNDPGYMQGYQSPGTDQAAPGYVGQGGPRVDKTHVEAKSGSNPVPDMPGAGK